MHTKLRLAATHVAVVVVFTAVYAALHRADPGHFGGAAFDPVYFAAITHTSLGFGDIVPKTRLARSAVVVHTAVALAVTVAFLKMA